MMTSNDIRLDNKPLSSYPKQVLTDLKLLMIDKYHSDFRTIGSSSYRGSLYPSDYDCFESITKDDRDKLIDFFKRNIQRIINVLVHKKHHFVLEVKMGLDDRYNINVGECKNGAFIINPDLPAIINNMYRNHLFDDDEYEEFTRVFSSSSPDQLDYEKLKKIIRKHYIIRWTPHEILAGIKHIPLIDEPLTIEEALEAKSPVNIEILSILNNKLVDESNFFQLVFLDKDSQPQLLNLDQNLVTDFKNTFIENLKKNMELLAYSKLEPNPMKTAKRLFSLARITHDKNLMNKIYPIVNSPLGMMYQVKSEIGTVIKLLEHLGNRVPKAIIKNQVQYIKYRISNMLFFTNEEIEKINDIINDLYKHQFDHKLMIDVLEHIKHKISIFVDESTIKMLKNVGLLPLPPDLLPKKSTFNLSLQSNRILPMM